MGTLTVMRIAIFGATGAIGSAIAAQARAAGHEVIPLSRDPEEMRAALTGADAVLSAIGPRSNTAAAADAVVTSARALVDAMSATGVRRLVLVSGAATDVPGDRKRLPHRVAGALVRRVARHVVDAKQRELDLVRTSALDWTAVRPGRVLSGAQAGGTRVSLQSPPGVTIARGDVAAFMLGQADSTTYLRQAPFISR